eukprot:603164-Rhodomonas_salina.1
MWASSTETRMNPEDLLWEFLSLTRFKIGKILVDGEFVASSAFEAFCEKRNMVLCPAVAYNHMMQAREKGAVRTCKEHVRCLLKSSNAPV